MLYMNRNDLAVANQHGLLDMQDNQAYSIANKQSTAVMYEEISPTWASGEIEVFKVRANDAYQTNTAAQLQNDEMVDDFYTEANEAYHMASAGATAVTYENISHDSSMNGRPDDNEVFTKPNEAYQTSAAMIESKKNEAYGALQ